MKKVITVIMIAVLTIGLMIPMTACDNSQGNSEKDTLNLMVYQPENDSAKTAYKEMIARFTKETGVNVKITFVPKDNYNTKLTTSFKTANNAPDVFFLDQPTLADNADKCMNLDEGFFAKEGEDGLHLSDFYQVAIDTVQYNGSTLAVPFSLTTSILLYNKSLVDQLPANWDEWRNMSVESGNALFGGVGSGGYASWYFQAFLKSAGGDMISGNEVVFNNAQGVTAATMLADLYAKSPESVRSSANAFTNGKVMFVLAHNSDIINYYAANPSFFENDLGATLFIPQESGGTSYSNIGGENIAINKDTDMPEEAKQLVKFLLREENVNTAIANNFSAIKEFAKVRTNNPITGEAYSEKLQEVLGVVLEQLETASARPVVKGWVKVNDNYLGAALADILDNGANIQEALNTAQQQASKVVKFD